MRLIISSSKIKKKKKYIYIYIYRCVQVILDVIIVDLFFYRPFLLDLMVGENSQIPCFGKICGKLALFQKYLAIYHFFGTRVPQNWVLNSTRVLSESPAWHCWPEICVIKKIMWYLILLKSSTSIVLELQTVEYIFLILFYIQSSSFLSFCLM